MTLAEYIAANLARPFAWGQFDCVLCAAQWVHLATGSDPTAGLPRWGDARQAARVVNAQGGIEAALDARFIKVHPNLARDGDIGIHEKSVCIFSGPHLVGPGPDGLQFIDRTKAKCAWSIS